MYNISQINSFQVKENSYPEESIYIDIGGPAGPKNREVIYKIALSNLNIIKFGYCCEPVAIPYPIYLTINGNEQKFEIGKTGMFEVQPEIFKNINNPDAEEEEINITITQVKVPIRVADGSIPDFNFKIDYVY